MLTVIPAVLTFSAFFFTIIGCLATERRDSELLAFSAKLWKPMALLAFILGPIALMFLLAILLADIAYAVLAIWWDGLRFFLQWVAYIGQVKV